MKKVGVLDIQGSVIEHLGMLEQCGVEAVRVKKVADLEGLSGLIMPGGESTTIGKLLDWYGLGEAIKEKVANGMALWGTCAGAILIAKEISGSQQAQSLRLMDMVIERNAYGRQLDSFETDLEFAGVGMLPAIFIRAPKIVSVGAGVEILAEYDGEIVAARAGKIMATTFHPELSEDRAVHRYFVGFCLD